MQAHFASLTSTPLHGPWKPPPTVSGDVLDISYEWNHMVRVTLWVWSSSIILLGSLHVGCLAAEFSETFHLSQSGAHLESQMFVKSESKKHLTDLGQCRNGGW